MGGTLFPSHNTSTGPMSFLGIPSQWSQGVPPPWDRLCLDRLYCGRYASHGFPQEDCLVIWTTRKSSCVNARGIPTAVYQVLLGGVPPPHWGSPPGQAQPGGYPRWGTPSQVWQGGYLRWSTPSQVWWGRGVPEVGVPPWLGYPPARSDREGGTQGGVSPWPVPTGGQGGYPRWGTPSQVWWGREVPEVGYPLVGVPLWPGLTGEGYPRWGTPIGLPPGQVWQGVPPSGTPTWTWLGYPPPTWTWLGYPPLAGPGWGTPLGVDRQMDGQTRVKT